MALNTMIKELTTIASFVALNAKMCSISCKTTLVSGMATWMIILMGRGHLLVFIHLVGIITERIYTRTVVEKNKITKICRTF